MTVIAHHMLIQAIPFLAPAAVVILALAVITLRDRLGGHHADDGE